MLSFVAQRVLKGVIVLLAIVVLNFFLIRLAPGDPAVVMAGEAGASDPVFVKQLREKFGLDKPLPEQLLESVTAALAPVQGVELVRVTDEDEYFPPPRELREVFHALDVVAALTLGADPTPAASPRDDRSVAASDVLASMAL